MLKRLVFDNYFSLIYFQYELVGYMKSNEVLLVAYRPYIKSRYCTQVASSF